MRTLVASLLLPIFAACITYTENVRFSPDGSGAVSARLVVPHEALARSPEAPLFRPDVLLSELTPEKLREKLNIDGITVDRLAIEETDTARVWDVQYRFADLESFRRARNEGRDVALRLYDSGTYELSIAFSGPERERHEGAVEVPAPAETEDEPVAQITASDSVLLTQLLGGFSATFVFEMPTPVISAPRGRVSGTTATLLWSYEREGIRVLEPKTMRVIFRKNALDWPTFEAFPREEPESQAQEPSY